MGEGESGLNAAPPILPGLKNLVFIGEGGMSTVWKAWDEMRGRFVAVKILKPELVANGEDLKLFVKEERTMAAIDHEGIVRSYDLSHMGGLWYYIMEYVDGYNFGDLLRRKQHLSEADSLLIAESVAVALDYAWNEFALVHCDIKPENIMITQEGTVKITDLGLARVASGAADADGDHVMGTPAYISPEQIYGDVELDCRADIYSLAATVYHLATGRVIFPGLDNEEMMRAHCDESRQGADPRRYRPELSEGFAELLEAMLVKDRDGRVANWSDVYEMCRLVEGGTAFKPRQSAGNSSIALFARA